MTCVVFLHLFKNLKIQAVGRRRFHDEMRLMFHSICLFTEVANETFTILPVASSSISCWISFVLFSFEEFGHSLNRFLLLSTKLDLSTTAAILLVLVLVLSTRRDRLDSSVQGHVSTSLTWEIFGLFRHGFGRMASIG
jgi:hypothetical protein